MTPPPQNPLTQQLTIESNRIERLRAFFTGWVPCMLSVTTDIVCVTPHEVLTKRFHVLPRWPIGAQNWKHEKRDDGGVAQWNFEKGVSYVVFLFFYSFSNLKISQYQTHSFWHPCLHSRFGMSVPSTSFPVTTRGLWKPTCGLLWPSVESRQGFMTLIV